MAGPVRAAPPAVLAPSAAAQRPICCGATALLFLQGAALLVNIALSLLHAVACACMRCRGAAGGRGPDPGMLHSELAHWLLTPVTECSSCLQAKMTNLAGAGVDHDGRRRVMRAGGHDANAPSALLPGLLLLLLLLLPGLLAGAPARLGAPAAEAQPLGREGGVTRWRNPVAVAAMHRIGFSEVAG